MPSDNKQYKDRLYNFIFGSEENKAWTLDLYNAVNNTDYTDPDDIEFTTIKQVLYLGMHNDVSFMVGFSMNLYEQQSTYNPNIPLRMLQYLGNVYEGYVNRNGLNKYGSTPIKLPVPKLVVFYNGEEDKPDEMFLQLADSFPEGADPDVSVRVKMININKGRNAKLMEKCEVLSEYSWIVEEIRQLKMKEHEEQDDNMQDDNISSVIDRVISDVPDTFVLKPFLEAHRAEVKGMLLEEYEEQKAMHLFKEEGRKEGIEEGRKEGIEEGKKEGDKFRRLMKELLSQGRHDDAMKAVTNEKDREVLYKEFNIL